MNGRLTFAWLGGLAITFIVSGCSSSETATTSVETPQPSSVSIVEGVAPTQSQQDRMLAAKEALFIRLSGRLMEVMGSQGPGGSHPGVSARGS